MFQTKQYNTRNALKSTLLNADGTPVDLTGCSVHFYMQSQGGEVVANRDVQIGENGQVIIVFELDEVEKAGSFIAEIIVIYPDGRKEIFPNDGYIRVIIHASIGGNQ